MVPHCTVVAWLFNFSQPAQRKGSGVNANLMVGHLDCQKCIFKTKILTFWPTVLQYTVSLHVKDILTSEQRYIGIIWSNCNRKIIAAQ